MRRIGTGDGETQVVVIGWLRQHEAGGGERNARSRTRRYHCRGMVGASVAAW